MKGMGVGTRKPPFCMLIGCGAVLSLFLMIVGGFVYEEVMRSFGAAVARVTVAVAAVILVGLAVRLMTLRTVEE